LWASACAVVLDLDAYSRGSAGAGAGGGGSGGCDDCGGGGVGGDDGTWVRRFGSTNGNTDFDRVALDASGVTVAGRCRGDISIDAFDLNCGAEGDLLVVHLDAGGTVAWAVQGGGTGTAQPTAVALDASGDVYVGGYAQGALAFGSVMLPGLGSDDAVVMKISHDGVLRWVRRFGDGESQLVRGLAVDDNGLYVIGDYVGALAFPPAQGQNANGRDLFVARLDPQNANGQWMRSFGDGSGQFGEGIAIATNGDLLITGECHGAMSFGIGIVACAASPDYTMFVARLDAQGGGLTSAAYGNAGTVMFSQSLARDLAGNSWIAGRINKSVDFGGGVLAPLSATDTFVASFTPGGLHRFSFRYGTSTMGRPDIAVDAAGFALLGADFAGSTDFGAGPLPEIGNGGDGVLLLLAPDDGALVDTVRIGAEGAAAVRGVALTETQLAATGVLSGAADVAARAIAPIGGRDGFVMRMTR
jgi:hypothetical protein